MSSQIEAFTAKTSDFPAPEPLATTTLDADSFRFGTTRQDSAQDSGRLASAERVLYEPCLMRRLLGSSRPPLQTSAYAKANLSICSACGTAEERLLG